MTTASSDARHHSPAEDPGLPVAAALFRALGEPNRLAILGHLEFGPHRVTDLTAHLGLAQSTVSQHLTCLRECGLVAVTPQGRASVYSLAHPRSTRAMLQAAEHVLGATGSAVTLCSLAGASTGARTDAR